MTRAAQLAGLGSLEGSAPAYACRAWVNFNGTGTVAIRASGNVSSITDNGTGDYTVNFTTAMPDASYDASGVCNLLNDGTSYGWFWTERARSASVYRINCTNVAYTFYDMLITTVSIHR